MSESMKLQAIFDLVDKSSKTLNKIERNLKKTKKATDKLTNSEKKLEKQSKKTAGAMSKSFKKIAGVMGGLAVGGTIIAGMKKGIELSNEFQQGMAEVATLTGQSTNQIINSYGKIVEGTQTTFGKDQQDVIKTLYDAFSAGVPRTQAAAQAFLTATGKMAVGGVASLKDSGDAITSVQNAWKTFDATITAENVANAMFGAVKAGKTTIKELAPVIGQVAPMAATVGLSMEEMFASIAQITKVGVSTSESVTQVNSALSSLLAPADSAAKLMKKFKLTNLKAKIQAQGFVAVLNEMRTKVKAVAKNESDEIAILQKLLGRKEALKATLALTNITQAEYNQTLLETARNGGQVNEATAKMQTQALANANAQEKWNNALKHFGDTLSPVESMVKTFWGEAIAGVTGYLDKIKLVKTAEEVTSMLGGDSLNEFIAKKAFQYGTPMGLAATALGAYDENPRSGTKQSYGSQSALGSAEKRGQDTTSNINLTVKIEGNTSLNKDAAQTIAKDPGILSALGIVKREKERQRRNLNMGVNK